MQTAGFIGLGNIGKPMALHLVQAFENTHVYDVINENCQPLAEAGAHIASSVAALASECQYIGVCVRDDKDVDSLIEQGLLGGKPGSYIAIHSTVTREGLQRWAEAAARNNITLIDAPITGGAGGAEAGTLCYMVGASSEALAKCEPYFQCSADKIVHAGELGAGMALKLCNNLITYAEFTAMSEATRLAEACGLSADVLREVGKSNGVINEQMHQFISNRNALAANCSQEEMAGIFGAFGTLGRKDLECALSTASQLGLRLPATEVVRDMIEDVFLNKA